MAGRKRITDLPIITSLTSDHWLEVADDAQDQNYRINGPNVGGGGGGGTPGGAGAEIQYRAGASSFGALTGSNVSGARLKIGEGTNFNESAQAGRGSEATVLRIADGTTGTPITSLLPTFSIQRVDSSNPGAAVYIPFQITHHKRGGGGYPYTASIYSNNNDPTVNDLVGLHLHARTEPTNVTAAGAQTAYGLYIIATSATTTGVGGATKGARSVGMQLDVERTNANSSTSLDSDDSSIGMALYSRTNKASAAVMISSSTGVGDSFFSGIVFRQTAVSDYAIDARTLVNTAVPLAINNNAFIKGRNQAASADVSLIGVDTLDRTHLPNTNIVFGGKAVLAGTTTPNTISDPVDRLHIQGVDAQFAFQYIDSYGTGVFPALVFRAARGTGGAGSATQSGDTIGSIAGRGYGATGFAASGRASIAMIATENWTDAAQGTSLTLETTPNGSTTRAARITVDHDGLIKLHSNALEFDEIAAPSNPAANKLRLYSADDGGVTKLYYKRSDGTVVELSTGGGGGTPGGSTKQIQFNNSGSFGGAAGFEYQSGASPNVLITAQNAAHVPLRVNTAASPSVDALQVQINGSDAFRITSAGGATITKDSTKADFQTNYGFKIADSGADTALLAGVSATTDRSIIQSLQPGISWITRPLQLQPNGGGVMIGEHTNQLGQFTIADSGTTYFVLADTSQGAGLKVWAVRNTAQKLEIATLDDGGLSPFVALSLTRAGDGQIAGGWIMPERTDPASPPTDHLHLYPKDDAGTTKLYYKRSNGTVVEIGGGAGGASTTQKFPLFFPAAGVVGGAASSLWDLPSTNPPSPVSIVGSNTITAALEFPDADGDYNAMVGILLPDDLTGAVDVKILWRCAATSGNVVWQIATAFSADGELVDPTFNTANTVTDAAKATTLQLNTATITGITMTGGAAGEMMFLKILRNRTHASDSLTGTVQLIGVEVTLRRLLA